MFGQSSTGEAISLSIKWGASVLRVNIKEMVKVAKMFNAHLKGVCNALVQGSSNAMAERLNGKIQEIKATVRGYSTFKDFRSAIPFFHGGLASTHKYNGRTKLLTALARIYPANKPT